MTPSFGCLQVLVDVEAPLMQQTAGQIGGSKTATATATAPPHPQVHEPPAPIRVPHQDASADNNQDDNSDLPQSMESKCVVQQQPDKQTELMEGATGRSLDAGLSSCYQPVSSDSSDMALPTAGGSRIRHGSSSGNSVNSSSNSNHQQHPNQQQQQQEQPSQLQQQQQQRAGRRKKSSPKKRHMTFGDNNDDVLDLSAKPPPTTTTTTTSRSSSSPDV